MNFLEKKVREWLLSFLFKEGIKVGTNTVYVYPTYIDMGGGLLQNVGYVNSDLAPQTDNTKDLGYPTYKWRGLFAGTVYSNLWNGQLVSRGNISTTGSANVASLVVSGHSTFGSVGHLIPGSDGSYNLGDATTRFNIHIPIFSSKPTAGASYLGRILGTRTTGKTTIWMCVQNSVGTYEWIELAIST
jgi:hypothetical protein